MVIIYEFIYTFKRVPVKIQVGSVLEIGKPILKFIWKDKLILKKNVI